MPNEQSSIRQRENTDLHLPKRYKVILYNDDFTTMDFVVRMLITIFHKGEAEAETLMLQVHHADEAVVGIYSYDIAVTKVEEATNMAHQEGFPLRITYTPE